MGVLNNVLLYSIINSDWYMYVLLVTQQIINHLCTLCICIIYVFYYFTRKMHFLKKSVKKIELLKGYSTYAASKIQFYAVGSYIARIIC